MQRKKSDMLKHMPLTLRVLQFAILAPIVFVVCFAAKGGEYFTVSRANLPPFAGPSVGHLLWLALPFISDRKWILAVTFPVTLWLLLIFQHSCSLNTIPGRPCLHDGGMNFIRETMAYANVIILAVVTLWAICRSIQMVRKMIRNRPS